MQRLHIEVPSMLIPQPLCQVSYQLKLVSSRKVKRNEEQQVNWLVVNIFRLLGLPWTMESVHFSCSFSIKCNNEAVLAVAGSYILLETAAKLKCLS